MTDGANGEGHDYRKEAADLGAGSAASANHSCIVANRTGGQGKTLLTEALYLALKAAGLTVRPAAIDTVGDAGRSKLRQRYPEVVDFTISADIDAVSNDGVKALTHWDRVAEMLSERNVLIDLGANVVQDLLRWAQVSDPSRMMRGRPVNFLVVVTAQENSAADAVATLAEIEKTRGFMEIGKVGVVLNELFGPFDQPGAQMNALLDAISAKGYPTVVVKKGRLTAIEGGYSLEKLIDADVDDFMKARGIEHKMTAYRQLDDAAKWLTETKAALVASGFAPSAV